MSPSQEDIVTEEVNYLQNNKFHQTKRFKWLMGIIVLGVFLFFGFVKFTEFLAGNLLRMEVSEQSKETYELDFSKLSINWMSTTIELTEASFYKVKAPINDTDKLDLDFKVNQLHIQLESLSAIYFSKLMHVKLIRITHPQLVVKKIIESDSRSSFSFETGKLYEVLQGFVSSFQVDELSIQNMHLEFFSPNKSVPFIVNDLSFTIKNFHLDSSAIASNNEIFFTESFDLKVFDQEILFNDGLHYAHFDSLVLSTKENKIEVFNVATDTLKGSKALFEKDLHNRYYARIPYTGIIGLDFMRAYQKDILHIDSMVYKHPDFGADFVNTSENSSQVIANPNTDNSIISLVLGVFKRVELDQFALNNASISVGYGENDSANIESLTLQFTKFVLDSIDQNGEGYYPNFKDLVLRIRHPKFNLPNQSVLRANDLLFSTFDSSLTINNVIISEKKGYGTPELMGEISSLHFVGINLQEIMTKRIVVLDSFRVVKPHIKLLAKKNKNPRKKFDIKSFLANDIHSFKIRRVEIEDGNIVLSEPLKHMHSHGVQRVNLNLNRFELSRSSIDQQKFLLSNSAYLSLEKLSVFAKEMQHEIDIQKAVINTRTRQISISNFVIEPLVIDSSTLKFIANIKAKTLVVNGVNLNNLKNINEIDVSAFDLKDVQANIIQIQNEIVVSDTTKGFDFSAFIMKLKKVELRNIAVENVDVSVQKNGVSVVEFSDAHVHANKLKALSENLKMGHLKFLTDSLSYGVKKVNLPLTAAKHTITIKNFERNIDSSIVITDFSMHPTVGVDIADSAFMGDIDIPKIEMAGFHTFEKRFSDTLEVGQFNIVNPKVSIRLPSRDTTKSKFKLLSHLPGSILGGEVNAVSLSSLNILNGDIELSKDNLRINVADFDLDSRNWFISDSSVWQPEKFFWADDFNVSLSQLSYDVPGLDFCHNIDSLSYHFTPNVFTIHGIYFNSVRPHKPDSSSYYSLYLPDIKIKNPHIYEYLHDSVLIIDTVVTRGGMLALDIISNSNKTIDAKVGVKIPTEIPSNLGGLHKIAIHNIELGKIDTEMRIHGKSNTAPLDVDEINLVVDSFSIMPGERLDSNRFLWAENITLDVDNIFTTLADGLYELGTDRLHISTKEGVVNLTNVSFVPAVNRYEFALYKGHQTDVLTIYTDDFEVSNFDFFSALYQKKIIGDHITIDRPSVDVLKDKRIPKPPYKRKETIPKLFKELPISISFDSLIVNDMRVRYEEFPEVGRSPGSITLTQMNIVAQNVTNDTARLRQDSTLRISMTSKFLDTSDLAFNLKYYMLTPNNEFEMTTTLGKLDGRLLNPFVEPVFLAEINSADIVGMDMTAIGNDSVSGGLMGLYYDNLKFTFLDEVSLDKKRLATKLKSGIGNAIIKKKNKQHPFKRRKPLYFKRDTSKGWIGYLIKIELSGISSSVGLKNYKKELKKTNKKLWKKFYKNDKKIRKERAKLEKKEGRKANRGKD